MTLSDIDKLTTALLMQAGKVPFENVAAENPNIVRDLSRVDPLRTAESFGLLLTFPELQANCFRLEVLVHLALAYSGGRAAPSQAQIRRSFKRIGIGYCGKMEDPSEDVFIALVNTPRGNFRIFEGLTEAAGFYLQRILNVLEGTPDTSAFRTIQESIESLLKLSEEVVRRAELPENLLGEEYPKDELSEKLVTNLSKSRFLLEFTDRDLARLNIRAESLSVFIFDLERRSQLRAQHFGLSDLEKRPLVHRGDKLHLLLPTAIVPAIIRHFLESVLDMGMADSFEKALAQEYSTLFKETRVLGTSSPKLIFQRVSGGMVASALTEIDTGRFLQCIFVADGLDGFVEGALSVPNYNFKKLSARISEHVTKAAEHARETAGFLDGLSLIVSCGFGRGFFLPLMNETPKNWRLESIAAHDLTTLSWLPDFNGLSLWKLLDSQTTLEGLRVELINANGLLNLVAWSLQQNGHLIPHNQMSGGPAEGGRRTLILVRQNAIRDLRHRILLYWSPRRALSPDAKWVRVRKLTGDTFFDEDREAPLYGSEDDLFEHRLVAIYVGGKNTWWLHIEHPDDAESRSVYEYWMMLSTWLRRAAPVIEHTFVDLKPGVITLRFRFGRVVSSETGRVKAKSISELRELVSVSSDRVAGTVRVNIRPGFEDGLAQPENIAERVLVEAIVAGAAKLASELPDAEQQQSAVQKICPDQDARWMHRFEAKLFRDFVGSAIPSRPILLDNFDNAQARIGTGWRARPKEAGNEISGIIESTSYLNSRVKIVLDDFCGILNGLDRESVLAQVLMNHESAQRDRDIWRRTARANIALHERKQETLETILERMGALNACFLSSRVVMEAAVSECPIAGGRKPGRLDITKLMSLAATAHHLGGWSDAVHWGAMEPKIRITPLGDIQMNQSFIEDIYGQFGRVGEERQVQYAADNYSKLYEPDRPVKSAEDRFETRFLDAWRAEFGITLDGFRRFVDAIENLGVKTSKAMLNLPRSQLLAMVREAAEGSNVDAMLTIATLTLTPRPNWRTVPPPFVEKDWYPWRFRRRLSFVRRPFLQLNEGPDPIITFAPGAVRDSFAACVRWYHSGEIPKGQPTSHEMNAWLGHANNVQRTKFNKEVAEKLRSLGWQAEKEVRLTKLLGRSLDKDYGDVDVLAWKQDGGRILAIECKDLQYLKAMGEVAEQLSDFRGEMRRDGHPDHLRRHLNRIGVLNANKDAVRRYLRLSGEDTIEAHLVFRNPVPMQFAWQKLSKLVALSLFNDLNHI